MSQIPTDPPPSHPSRVASPPAPRRKKGRDVRPRIRTPAEPSSLARLAAKMLEAGRRILRPRDLACAKPRRFFARVRCFDLSCPRCGAIVSTSPHTDPGGRNLLGKRLVSQPPTKGWNPVRSLLVCPGCELRLILGIVAWVVPREDSPQPPDLQARSGEARDLRQAWDALDPLPGLLLAREGIPGGGSEFGNLILQGEPGEPLDSGQPGLAPGTPKGR